MNNDLSKCDFDLNGKVVGNTSNNSYGKAIGVADASRVALSKTNGLKASVDMQMGGVVQGSNVVDPTALTDPMMSNEHINKFVTNGSIPMSQEPIQVQTPIMPEVNISSGLGTAGNKFVSNDSMSMGNSILTPQEPTHVEAPIMPEVDISSDLGTSLNTNSSAGIEPVLENPMMVDIDSLNQPVSSTSIVPNITIPEPPREIPVSAPSAESKFNVDIPIIGDHQNTISAESTSIKDNVESNQGVISNITEPVVENVTPADVIPSTQPVLENPISQISASETFVQEPAQQRIGEHSGDMSFSLEMINDSDMKELKSDFLKLKSNLELLFSDLEKKINKLADFEVISSKWYQSLKEEHSIGENELDAAINRGFDKVDGAIQSQQPQMPTFDTTETTIQPRI